MDKSQAKAILAKQLVRYRTKTYADLLQPAIDAATLGHPVSFWAAGNHARTFEKVSAYPSSVKGRA